MNTEKNIRDNEGFIPIKATAEGAFSLNHSRRELIKNTMIRVRNQFSKYGQSLTKEHEENLERMVNCFVNFEQEKCDLITCFPGYGKSTVRNQFLIEFCIALKHQSPVALAIGGYLVVVEKIEEARAIEGLIFEECGYYNEKAKTPFCHLIHGWRPDSVERGQCQNSEVETFRDCQGSRCPHFDSCGIQRLRADTEKTPILIITHSRFNENIADLSGFNHYDTDEGAVIRKIVLIDEKPDLAITDCISTKTVCDLENKLEACRSSRSVRAEKSKTSALRNVSYSISMRLNEFRKQNCLTPYGLADAGLFKLIDIDCQIKYLEELLGEQSDPCLNTLKRFAKKDGIYCRDNAFILFVPDVLSLTSNKSMHAVILSGTGCIDPDLRENPEVIQIPFTTSRTYDNLYFHVIKNTEISATKTSMANETSFSAVSELIKHELSEMPPESTALVATYQPYSSKLYNSLGDLSKRVIPYQSKETTAKAKKLPYFGGVNGSNAYNKADYVICAGLGRYDELTYITRALCFDFKGDLYEKFEEFVQKEERMDHVTDRLIGVHDYMVASLARDLIQLLYRSKLRNYYDKTPIHVYLINPYPEVLQYVSDWFVGCQIEIQEELPEACILVQTTEKIYGGGKTKAGIMLSWLQDWDGTPKSKADIMKALSLNENAWKRLKKDSAIKLYLENHVKFVKVAKETVYYKTEFISKNAIEQPLNKPEQQKILDIYYKHREEQKAS